MNEWISNRDKYIYIYEVVVAITFEILSAYTLLSSLFFFHVVVVVNLKKIKYILEK